MDTIDARLLLVGACLLPLALAGCADAADSRPGGDTNSTGNTNETDPSVVGDDEPGTELESFRGVGCEGAFLVLHPPKDRAQALLPDDLEATGGPHDSLAWAQLRHAKCDRLVIDNSTEFLDYREVQVWIQVKPPASLEPPAGWYSYYTVRLWQTDGPMSLFAQRGISTAEGSYSQTTETVVPDVWAVTVGDFQPASEQEAWSFRMLSDDLPVADTVHYRVFYGDEDLGYYDLLVEGRHSNQDYGGLMLAEEDSTVASLSGTGAINIAVGGIYAETVLAGQFDGG